MSKEKDYQGCDKRVVVYCYTKIQPCEIFPDYRLRFALYMHRPIDLGHTSHNHIDPNPAISPYDYAACRAAFGVVSGSLPFCIWSLLYFTVRGEIQMCPTTKRLPFLRVTRLD